ncbi:SPOR domain-containing protein [Pseudaestuariivita atlantica]|nr:SPOR domain-containing protein [Pseudaestuariivita atlantica]
MSVKRGVVAAAVVAAMVAGGALAQSLNRADEPAEFPPASYTGKQYVDSKGCVYIRAGIDGNTTWVPRVSRSRQHVCGQTPSLSGVQVAAAPAPAPEPSVTVITIEPTPEIPVIAPAPKLAPRVVAKPRPKPAPKPQPVRVAKAAPRVAAPKPVLVRPTMKTPVVVMPAGKGPCPERSTVSQTYMSTKTGLFVRCGPQPGGHGAAAPSGPIVVPQQKLTYGTQVPAATAQIKAPNQIGIKSKRHAKKLGLAPAPSVHPQALVIPKHVYAENVAEQQHTVKVPHGYRPAWDDDRLNPRRAYGTLAGKAQMDLAWTRTVPRKLIDRKTGRDVTADFPTLYYPFTSQAQLDAARLAKAQGKKVKVRVEYADTPRVSTKSAPQVVKTKRRVQPAAAVQAPKVARAASHRFVQVGTYGNPANARAATRRLQGMGLPVKIGLMTRKGRKLEVVLAGPFRTQDQLNAALAAARRAGFGDAFFRR